MSEQDTEQVSATTLDEEGGVTELNPGGSPPEDDRNEEADGSPVPDPEADDGDDIPGAD